MNTGVQDQTDSPQGSISKVDLPGNLSHLIANMEDFFASLYSKRRHNILSVNPIMRCSAGQISSIIPLGWRIMRRHQLVPTKWLFADGIMTP